MRSNGTGASLGTSLGTNLTPANRLCRSVIIALLVLIPLAILPGAFFYFDVTPKTMLLLFGTATALVCCSGRPPVRQTRELRWLHWLLGMQGVSLTVSTLLSTDRALSLTGSGWRRFGLVVQLALLLYVFLLSRVSVRPLLRAVAASGSLAALYGIAQYFGWDPWLPRQGYHIGEGIGAIVRPPGTLGHADYFGVYLLYVMFAGIALASDDQGHWWRKLGVVAAGAAVAAVLLSGTRAAILGLAVGVALLALGRRPRLTARRAAAVAALAGMLVIFYLSPAGVPLQNRVRWYRGDPYGGGRLTVWADTMRMAGKRWLAGYGLETYSSQFPRFESEALARQFPDRYYESAHNIFLDAFAAQGLPGVLLLLAAAALGIWCSRRAAAMRTTAGILSTGFAAALVADQFVAFTLPTALLFYATLAMLCSLTQVEGEPARATPRSLRKIPAMIAAASVAAVLVVGALSLTWADYWLSRTRDSLAAGSVPEGMRQYERLRRWAPPGFDTDLWYSRTMVAALQKTPAAPPDGAAWNSAFQAALRASRASEERANACYNLAALYASANDFGHTEQALRAAIGWAPEWYKPRWMLAQVLREAGRLEEAESEAHRAVELNGGQHEEVAQTWNEIRARVPPHN